MFRGDAEFVDIIHTNSGNLWEGCLSFAKNLGHVDFYPAGGSHQANVFSINQTNVFRCASIFLIRIGE